MERWKSTGKKWNLKEAQALDIHEIAKMSLPEKAELAQFYRNQFQLRANTFVKALVVPYAFSKMYKDYEEIANSPKISDVRKAINPDTTVVISNGRYRELSPEFDALPKPGYYLTNYIHRFQSFFNAKSSTVKGWEEISRQQDTELFGADYIQKRKYTYVTDENGKRRRIELQGPFFEIRPKNRLTDVERVKFWSIVDEAKRAGWLNKFGYSSEQMHRQIATLWTNSIFSTKDIDDAYDTIYNLLGVERLKEGKYPEHKSGIVGDFFQQVGDEDALGEVDIFE